MSRQSGNRFCETTAIRVRKKCLSFRGRERSKRSPESIPTGASVAMAGGMHCPASGYGFRARWEVGIADLPAPRNDSRSDICDAVTLRRHEDTKERSYDRRRLKALAGGVAAAQGPQDPERRLR